MSKNYKYGFDVAVNRADDLDKCMLEHIAREESPSVIDIGCGLGGQSLRMALSGAKVFAVDIDDYEKQFIELRDNNNLSEEQLMFLRGNLRDVESVIGERTFEIGCLQRVIHYLPYNDALLVLKSIRNSVKVIYISVSGLDSAIGEGYVDKDKSVTERFCHLSAESREKFFITKPICLYTEKEFRELVEVAGWKIEKVWVSAFGNIKAILI